ncbi:NUDIX hydrolase [Phenylobacterium sp.]|jgi:8-oxo-dGTP pyrophosphatase MutT (NUDIX family)|uniref:NUDIX hydrolase n=1 Tax=Phenylobacterium sp. TaxID=1871053 RepID=UPI002F411FFE
MKRARLVGIQYAALPYRLTGRRLSILLISSRRTRRWIIPKGWPMEGRKPHEAAAVEAHEEAGVEGEIADQPLGSYRYLKEVKDGVSLAVQVIVFPMLVENQAAAFKEEGQRVAAWFRYRHAAGLVAEPSLKRLILDFGDAQSTNLLVRGLRRYRTWRFRAQAGDLPI